MYEYYHAATDSWYKCADQHVAKSVYKQQQNLLYGKVAGNNKPNNTRKIGDIETNNGLDYVWNGSNWVPKWITDPVVNGLMDP